MKTLAESTLDRIDAVIEQNSILKHPFYQAWQRGELTREALRDYAGQYYHHVAAFPTYLSALHSHTPDLATRQAILENLIDEERGAQNHPELWLQFAEGVGADRVDAISSTPCPETMNLIDKFKNICLCGTVAEGLAALYAYESQIPAVSTTKIAGLKQFYGIHAEPALQYFTVHAEADVVHSANERQLLADNFTDTDASGSILAAEYVTSALWNVLSGVCERHDIAC